MSNEHSEEPGEIPGNEVNAHLRNPELRKVEGSMRIVIIVGFFCMSPYGSLGQPVPATRERSEVVSNKFATILYSTWHDRFVDVGYTRLVATGPPWAYSQFYWWGLPEKVKQPGEYRFVLNQNGKAVSNQVLINRHADLLAAAGIDFITIDATNAESSIHPAMLAATKAVCETYAERMKKGIPTPRIAFFYGGFEKQEEHDKYLSQLIRVYYEAYPANLFFHYNGRPLLLGGKEGETSKPMSYFTFRRTEGWRDARYWSFKQQTAGMTPFVQKGWPEEMSVVPATGAPISGDGAVGRRKGRTFEEQWERISVVQPTFVFVTGWNEWGAQYLGKDGVSPFFVDQYSQEFSSDIEPMTGGHGDDYYKNMIAFIRSYKRNVPGFAYRDVDSGQWWFKSYRDRPANGHEPTNFVWELAWIEGSTARYRPVVRYSASGELDFIALYDTTTGTWHFRRHRGEFVFTGSVSCEWPGAHGLHYQPFVFNLGDDKSFAIGLRDTTTGTWHFRVHMGDFSFGGSTSLEWREAVGEHYQPVVQNFGSNSQGVIGLWDKTDGNWHFRHRKEGFSFGGSSSFRWVVPGQDYQPFLGDFDGDGSFDLAIRRDDGRINIANGNGQGSFDHKDTFLGPAGAKLQFR